MLATSCSLLQKRKKKPSVAPTEARDTGARCGHSHDCWPIRSQKRSKCAAPVQPSSPTPARRSTSSGGGRAGSGRLLQCWSPSTSAYFDGVRAAGADSCDANWFTAGSGDLANPAGRPSFSAPAPAVLGYDASIFDFCTQQDVSGGGGGGGGSWQADLVARCVGANLNALRVLRGWNMCLNFRWLVCRSTFGQGLQRTDQGRHAHTHTRQC